MDLNVSYAIAIQCVLESKRKHKAHSYTHTHARPYLCVDAALDGPAVDGDVLLFVEEGVTLGDADHLLHQVQPSDELCDWMLHLEAVQPMGRQLQRRPRRTWGDLVGRDFFLLKNCVFSLPRNFRHIHTQFQRHTDTEPDRHTNKADRQADG